MSNFLFLSFTIILSFVIINFVKNYISGNVRKVIYESSSPFKVGIFKVRDTNIEELSEYIDKIISFTGSFDNINLDLDYIFYGEITEHPKYGTQFNVQTYEIKEPDSSEGTVIYLSSGLFKGIGFKTAKRIVDKFGDKTIEIIKNDYISLTKVNGVTEDKAFRIHTTLVESNESQEYILKLTMMGFSIKEATDLVAVHKSNIFNIIEENIYELIDLVSFNKLDTIYLNNNKEDNGIRIEALISYYINKICYETGDTLVCREELLVRMKSSFNDVFSLDTFLLYLNKMIKDKKIYEVDNLITLKSYYDTEKLIYNNIKRLNNIRNGYDINKINYYIDEYEKRNGITFADKQKEAIVESIIHNFYIITGGPGTGKTTIIKAIVEIIKDLDLYTSLDIALLAPTGRSAKRLGEAVFEKSSTIHKYLKWNKDTNSFQVDENNKSTEKVVIVDEASMIDIFLFSSLLKGLQLNIKLILVGDANQLPSIGPGDILNDLISNDEFNKTCLNEIYRVKDGNYITYLANDVKNRKEFSSNEINNEDVKFIESNDNDIIPYLTQICENAHKKKIKIDNFQVLAPMYKGDNGIDNINKLMAVIFNKDEKKYILNDRIYRVGDKVIQLVNDVDNNVFNGDIGYISEINFDSKVKTIVIDFMGNPVEYKQRDFDKFTLAYAISIHKSQGSEYDNVVIVLAKSFSRMFYNKLIYTAITRAKKSLVILGSIDSFNKAIQTMYATDRKTYLKSINK